MKVKKRVRVNSSRAKSKLNLLIFFLVFFSALFIILGSFFVGEFILKEISFAPTNTITISDCGVLSQADTEYLLDIDPPASNDHCFTISANNIVLNGQGHSIVFSNGGSNNRHGVFIDGANNTVVKDLKMGDGTVGGTGEFGVYIRDANNTLIENLGIKTYNDAGVIAERSDFTFVYNSIINASGNGIQFNSASDGIISGNNISTFESGDPIKTTRGIYLVAGSSFNSINNNLVIGSNTNGHGIQLQDSSFNQIDNTIVRTFGSDGDALRMLGGNSAGNNFNNDIFASFGDGARSLIVGSVQHDFTISNTFIEALGTGSKDIEVSDQSKWGTWVFIDSGYLDSNLIKRFSDVVWNTGNGTMIVYWKFDTTVVDSSAQPIEGVSVKGTSFLGSEVFNLVTGADGKISTQNLLEFVRVNGGNPTYYTDYNIEYSKTGFDSSIETINFADGNIIVNKQLTSSGNNPPLEAPVITIQAPVPQSYGYNDSLELNYSVSSSAGLNECKYNFDNGANISANCNLNTHFNISGGIHTLYLFASDVNGLNSNASVTFQINLGSPSILLTSPEDNFFLNNKNDVTLRYVPSDDGNIVSCSLYGDFNGTYGVNQTDNTILEDVQNNFEPMNLTERAYIWNVLCIDNEGKQNFAFRNFTFGIDTIDPVINITSPLVYPSSISCSRSINLRYNINEANKDYCYYNIKNATDTIISDTNVSSCESTSASINSMYEKKVLNLTLYAVDKAGRTASSTVGFYIDTSDSSCITANQTDPVTGSNNPINNTRINSTTPQQQNPPSNTPGDDNTADLQRVSLVDNATSISVKDGEKIILNVNGQDYEATIEVDGEEVSVNIGSGTYTIEKGKIVSVLLGSTKVYLGAKDVKTSGASLIAGLDQTSIKNNVGGASSKRTIAYILMISVLVILIAVIIVIIYYVLKTNQEVHNDKPNSRGPTYPVNQQGAGGYGYQGNFGNQR
ncbi:MAG: right-handed parallel beta-helix repeat-containing protein [Nanoarchaeota archaeon]|nr:right-handed parallel beta-helix repeat-containing protein [Nanoarchaeota archaeon]